jgi:simple sugar transport system ATP-binding protein
MSVADNIFLGRSITRHGFVQDTLQKAEARRVLDQLGLDLEVDLPLDTYPIAIQQLVEVAKAMSIQAKVNIMEEPTSALNAPEVRKLFRLMTELKAKGYGIAILPTAWKKLKKLPTEFPCCETDSISVQRLPQNCQSPN